jgi:regulator of protease activity HflC (stomatin/prohibitin superfamily)
MIGIYFGLGLGCFTAIGFVAGIRIIRPTQKGLVERLGKYHRFANNGFNWIMPLIDNMVVVNITETMVDAQSQEIITKDNLNATVDAQVYFKVKADENSVKATQYAVNNYKLQIVSLARTTLRNIIGNMSLKDANSDRNKINKNLMETLRMETKNWGLEIVRTELKEINPPKDVQETMNKVVKAENEKLSAVDFATAIETEADGKKRAKIKEAEGIKQSTILKAEGESHAFNLINKAFVGNAQLLKQMEVTQASLQNNSKIVLTEKGINHSIIMDAIPIRS